MKRKIWLILAVVTGSIYILWRIFFTVPTQYGLVSLIAGLALVIAGAISVIEAFSHCRNMSGVYAPEKPDIPMDWYPSVDVLIATHNEPTELLYKTVNGCKYMKYPDKQKVHIYICDDTNRPEIRQLAKDLGVNYFGLSENKQAKAGNLNHALSLTSSDLVVTFDADMIPRSKFLMETVPYFFLPMMKKNEEGDWVKREAEEIDEKYKIGFIQTPQSFYNPDLFQFNLYAEKSIPNEQDYFFKDVNVGRNRSNSPIYAGSNTIITRQALEEVGGITTGNITEDFATGIKIQAKGYTCYATGEPLAHGMAPVDFKSLIKQRQRWGRGCVQTIRSFKFLFSELPIGTKFSYITCFLYWWTFIRRFIYIISPILFTVFGLVVVDCSLKELLFIWLPSYVIYNRSLKVLSGKIRDQKWSNIVDTTIFPYMMIPILAETIGIKLKKFAVTPKAVTSERNVSIRYAIPHILLAVADVVALVMCVYEMIVYKNVGNIIILYWLIVNLYFLVMAIIFMIGRINYRSDERFYAAVLVELETPYEVLEGYTLDLSEGGLAVELDNPQFIPPDEDLNVTVTYDDYKAIFKARIKHVQQLKKGWKYSIKVVEMSKYDKQEYMQIIYDREHTLATKINSYFIKDIYGAIKGKAHHGFLSNRKLPRIPLEFSVQSVEGQSIKIVNYNYEYLLLQGIYREEEIHLRVGGDNQITCMPEHRDEKLNYTLCKIKAWKEVARNQSIQTCLLYKPQKVVVSQDIGGMSV